MTKPSVTPDAAPDLSPDAIAAPRARALYDWWRARRGPRDMPARADFLAEELVAWWPDLILYEVERDANGKRLFRFRVHGSNAVQADGINYTGRHLTEVIPPAYSQAIVDCYEAAIARRRPFYSTGHRTMKSGLLMSFERLLLPFGRAEVTHVMALLLWSIPAKNVIIDALAAENLPFVNDVIGFVVP